MSILSLLKFKVEDTRAKRESSQEKVDGCLEATIDSIGFWFDMSKKVSENPGLVKKNDKNRLHSAKMVATKNIKRYAAFQAELHQAIEAERIATEELLTFLAGYSEVAEHCPDKLCYSSKRDTVTLTFIVGSGAAGLAVFRISTDELLKVKVPC